MAAPVTDAGEFESWLNDRLESLEVDREVYGAYILGVLQEEETDEEKEDALQGILSAFLVIIQGGMSPLGHRDSVFSCVAYVSCCLWRKLSTLGATVFLQLRFRHHRRLYELSSSCHVEAYSKTSNF